MTVLETRRLILRRVRDEDFALLAEVINNYRIAENTARIPWPYTPDDAVSFIRLERHRSAGSCHFVITVKGRGDAPKGGIGIEAERPKAQGELGYWLAESLWRQGFGLEAARCVVVHGFEALGHEVLHAGYRHGNEGSRRILDQLGFRFVRHAAVHSLALRGPSPTARLELTRKEWLRSRKL
jgi:RimJ/RimL family protein N-acetyltransferase